MAAVAEYPPTEASREKLSRAYIRYALVLLLIIHTLNFVDRQIINILAHPIQQELGLSDTQLGLMTGLAFAVFYSILGIPIARYADNGRSNRPRIIALSLFIWSGMTALCGAAQSFTQLVLARVGVGIGEAGCTPPAHSLIGDYVPPEKRASAIALYGLGLPIGALLGMSLGGVLADAYGWRVALMAVGFPGVLIALIAWATLREPRTQSLLANAAATQERSSFWQVAGELLRSRTFCLIVAGAAVWSLLAYGKTTWATILLARVHGLSAAEIGLYYGISVGIAGMLGTLLGGSLADRFGKRDPRWYLWVPALAITVTMPLLAWGYASSDWRLVLVLIFLPTMASSMYYGPTFAAIQLLVRPEQRAVSVSIVLLAANLFGAGLGPLAFGFLSDQLKPYLGADSVRWVLVIAAFLGLVAAAIYWQASRSFQRRIQ